MVREREMTKQHDRNGARTFSEAELKTNAKAVVSYAAKNGTAVVTASDGRPVVIIDIPTVDLPTLD
jgi:hypothetical protein